MASFYLDNIDWKPRDLVRCKAITPDTSMTPGKTYTVLAGGYIADDSGENILPSSRFTFANKGVLNA